MKLRTSLALTKDSFPVDFKSTEFSLDGKDIEEIKKKLLRSLAAVAARSDYPDANEDAEFTVRLKYYCAAWGL